MTGLLAHVGMMLDKKYRERNRLSNHAFVLFYKGTLIRVPQAETDTPEEIATRAMEMFGTDAITEMSTSVDIDVVLFCRNPMAKSTYVLVQFAANMNIYNVLMSKSMENDTTDLNIAFAARQRQLDFRIMIPFLVATFDGKLFIDSDMYKQTMS